MSQATSPWRVLRLAKPQWARLAIGTFCLMLGSAAGLVYPQAIRIVLDEAQGSASQELINLLAAAMLAVAGVQSLAVAFRYYLFTTAGERIVASLRQQLFGSLVEQEVGFFDQQKTGELLNRLSSDTTVLQNTVSVNISMGLRSVATATGGTIFLFITSPSLAALILVVLPPIVIGAVVYGRSLRKLAREVQDSLARASAIAEETLGGIRTVRAFTAEKRQSQRYDSTVEDSFALARKRSLIGAIFVSLVSGLGLAASVLVLWIGGSMVVERSLSVGELSAFLVYTIIVAASLGTLSDLWADFMKASGAAARVFELLDREPELARIEMADPPTGAQVEPFAVDTNMAHQGTRIEMSNISFSYPSRPDKPVLQNVSITFPPRSVTALVGPSGSGKSTVASLLCRLYDPNHGLITRNGLDIRTLDPTAYRSTLGVVNQEPILFSSTIEENLRIAQPNASLEELEAAAKAAYADEFIDQFPSGFQTEVGERGIQLSGGQKQRIAIARALLRNPELLILDEATSALDSESEHLVKQALNGLMAGRTTVVIAHRLSTVKDADQVIVLEQGRIAQQGTHASLLEVAGTYRQLVERQFIDGTIQRRVVESG